MNFDDAIKAHSSWKLKLSNYLRKPDGSLKHEDVCKDHLCELGKWIYGEGQGKYTNLLEFGTLKSEHARFHKAASEIVKKADKGENLTEDVAIGGDSEFSKASTAVVAAIMKMKSKAA